MTGVGAFGRPLSPPPPTNTHTRVLFLRDLHFANFTNLLNDLKMEEKIIQYKQVKNR